jgi:phosphate transport system ATP-binding protein
MEPRDSALIASGIEVSILGRRIVGGIDLSLKSNAVTAIVGPSGCGKSTLLIALANLPRCLPRAEFKGTVTKRNPHDFVGLVFQKSTPFRLSIFENVALALRETGISKRHIEERVQDALVSCGLWSEVKDRLQESALELSGGQLQRLCLARTLALNPSVLLLDEPCSSLDPIASQAVEQTIREIARSKAVIMITHNLLQAKRLADELIVLWNEGDGARILEQGRTQDLFQRPEKALVRSYLSGVIG